MLSLLVSLPPALSHADIGQTVLQSKNVPPNILRDMRRNILRDMRQNILGDMRRNIPGNRTTRTLDTTAGTVGTAPAATGNILMARNIPIGTCNILIVPSARNIPIVIKINLTPISVRNIPPLGP